MSATRAIWKGHITFGLVQVPIQLFPAERRHDLQFKLLDSRDKARIRYERINEMTGEEVPWNDVVKAFEYDDKNYVVLSDEDFKRAAVEVTQTIAIREFVDLKSVNPLYFDKPYYLVPGKHGEKGYALLREAMRRTQRAGVAKVVIRTREYLSVLLTAGPALALMLLRFHQELRDPAKLDLPADGLKSNDITPRDVDMAVQLIENLTESWSPAKYHDDYRDALMKWIERKAHTRGRAPAPIVEEPETEEPRIINITELLQKSLKKPIQRTSGRRATRTRDPRRRKTG